MSVHRLRLAGGLGFATALALAVRGRARMVIVTATGPRARAEALARELAAAAVEHRCVACEFVGVPLELASLERVATTAREIGEITRELALRALILNAGIAYRPYARSADGHEMHFAVNVLGHHLLARLLAPRLRAARPRGRIVSLSGDIYCLTRGCSSDFSYARGCNPTGALAAYCRSKLGVLWHARELARRASLSACAVHPGVVGTRLVQGLPECAVQLVATLGLVLTPSQGAWAAAALAMGDSEPQSGAYYHCLTMRPRHHGGPMLPHELPADDPAGDAVAASALYARCEDLCAHHLKQAEMIVDAQAAAA